MKFRRAFAALAASVLVAAGRGTAGADTGQQHALEALGAAAQCVAAARDRSTKAVAESADPSDTLHAKYLYATAIEEYDECEKRFGAGNVAYRVDLSLQRALDRSALMALLHNDTVSSGDLLALVHDDLVTVCGHYSFLPDAEQPEAQTQVKAYDAAAATYKLTVDDAVDTGCAVTRDKKGGKKH